MGEVTKSYSQLGRSPAASAVYTGSNIRIDQIPIEKKAQSFTKSICLIISDAYVLRHRPQEQHCLIGDSGVLCK